jgi:hypothetical protein
MLITTFKSLLEHESITDVVSKLVQCSDSAEIAILTTQFPSIVDANIKIAYMNIPYIFPTYLCNLSDYYPNIDTLIVRTTKIKPDELIHKYRITILLCADIPTMQVFENNRQITILTT